MGPCSGCGGGGGWSFGGVECCPRRRSSSSSSSVILRFSRTQFGQNDVDGSWLCSLFSCFRLEMVFSVAAFRASFCSGTLHSVSGDLSSREASRTSLKMKSIFFLFVGGWPSASSLDGLPALGLVWEDDCRHGDLKSPWTLDKTSDFLLSAKDRLYYLSTHLTTMLVEIYLVWNYTYISFYSYFYGHFQNYFLTIQDSWVFIVRQC